MKCLEWPFIYSNHSMNVDSCVFPIWPDSFCPVGKVKNSSVFGEQPNMIEKVKYLSLIQQESILVRALKWRDLHKGSKYLGERQRDVSYVKQRLALARLYAWLKPRLSWRCCECRRTLLVPVFQYKKQRVSRDENIYDFPWLTKSHPSYRKQMRR